jgi:hypothetical protein
VSAGPTHDELARLRSNVETAYETWKDAKQARERDYHVAAREVVTDLVDLRDSVLHRTPDAPDPQERPGRERDLTLALCDRLRERPDLVLVAVGNSDDLRIVDLSIERVFREADAALTAAQATAESFEKDNAAALKEESDQAELDGIRRAFERNDLDAVREGLSPSPQAPVRNRVTRAG